MQAGPAPQIQLLRTLLRVCITWGLLCWLSAGVVAGEDPTPLTPAEQLSAARAAYAANDLAQAERLFQTLCDQIPDNGNHRFELARVQYRREEYQAAWDNFQKAELLHATAAHQSLWCGFTAFKLERWADTERLLGAVPEAEATDEIRLKRAIAQFNLGRPEAPVALSALAAQDTPAGHVAQYYLAMIEENAGAGGAAFDLYRPLLAVGEPFQSAARDRLRALQPAPWTFRLELTGGYDSRPARVNDDTNRAGAAADGFAQGSFRFAVRPFYALGSFTPVIYWLSVGGYLREYTRSHDLDYALVSVSQSLENSPERTFNFRIDNTFRRHWLGHVPYFDQVELSGAVQWRNTQGAWTHAGTLGLSGALSDALGPDFESQEGLEGGASASYALSWANGGQWSFNCPFTISWAQRSASNAAESYGQSSLQIAPSLTLGQRLLISLAAEIDNRLYRPDSANGGQRRKEWPITISTSVETPLWAHTSVQANFQLVEQDSNQAANRYTNRQMWVSFYLWY